jgi:hypothetical protein
MGENESHLTSTHVGLFDTLACHLVAWVLSLVGPCYLGLWYSLHVVWSIRGAPPPLEVGVSFMVYDLLLLVFGPFCLTKIN